MHKDYINNLQRTFHKNIFTGRTAEVQWQNYSKISLSYLCDQILQKLVNIGYELWLKDVCRKNGVSAMKKKNWLLKYSRWSGYTSGNGITVTESYVPDLYSTQIHNYAYEYHSLHGDVPRNSKR